MGIYFDLIWVLLEGFGSDEVWLADGPTIVKAAEIWF